MMEDGRTDGWTDGRTDLQTRNGQKHDHEAEILDIFEKFKKNRNLNLLKVPITLITQFPF
jgi:hypothetical protein